MLLFAGEKSQKAEGMHPKKAISFQVHYGHSKGNTPDGEEPKTGSRTLKTEYHLPECVCEMRYIDSALLTPCAEYQRVLRTRKVAEISATFSEYVANEPKVSYRDGRYHVFDGQNTIEARVACNGGRDLPILCKVFHGLSKKDEALLFAVQTGMIFLSKSSMFAVPVLPRN